MPGGLVPLRVGAHSEITSDGVDGGGVAGTLLADVQRNECEAEDSHSPIVGNHMEEIFFVDAREERKWTLMDREPDDISEQAICDVRVTAFRER